MNRHLMALLVLLLAVSGPGRAAAREVVFIRYRIAPTYFQNVVDGFKEEMARRGYVEGKNITYRDVLTSTADQRSVPEVLATVDRYLPTADMFITCGWVSMYARKKLKGTGVPQLFVPVLRSVALKMLPSMDDPPGTNLSGIHLMYPPEKILRLTRLILPAAKRYGYVFDSRIPADMVFKAAYEELPVRDHHGLEILFFDLAGGVDRVLADMAARKVAAYGGIVGSFKKRKELAASNLPVITSFTLDIRPDEIDRYVRDSNVVAGLFTSFASCGRQAADMTADIFDGRTTIEKTVPRASRLTAFVNLVSADRMGLHIPFAALEAVDLVVR